MSLLAKTKIRKEGPVSFPWKTLFMRVVDQRFHGSRGLGATSTMFLVPSVPSLLKGPFESFWSCTSVVCDDLLQFLAVFSLMPIRAAEPAVLVKPKLVLVIRTRFVTTTRRSTSLTLLTTTLAGSGLLDSRHCIGNKLLDRHLLALQVSPFKETSEIGDLFCRLCRRARC